jgi:hypothetical protein
MNRKKLRNRLPTQQSMDILNTKYPHINYIPGENLNIMDATIKMLKTMWMDRIKYPTIRDMEKPLNMTEKTVLRLAKLNNLEPRRGF